MILSVGTAIRPREAMWAEVSKYSSEQYDKHIKTFGENYDIKEIGFDPWNAQDLVTGLEQHGFTMVKHDQTQSRN